MIYSTGNYEAFAKTDAAKDINEKIAHIIGGGIAGLATAVFLIRDGHMNGKNINIYEELDISGGSMDGIYNPNRGYIIRGGREIEVHYECIWDLLRSIPSIENKDLSVFDEFYQVNKVDPSFSYTRAIEHCGKRIKDDGKLTLTKQSIKELILLVMTPENKLQNIKINEVFSPEFFKSNFWLYWATMFAFEPWASAMEMRRYVLRFIHHIGTLADMSALKFSKYNQYESFILPIVNFLKKQNVNFHYNTEVSNVIFDISDTEKTAKKIEMIKDKKKINVSVRKNDLVFIANGSITEGSTYGTNSEVPSRDYQLGASWQLWKNIANQDKDFGKPDKFCEKIPKANWIVSATITLYNDIVTPYIEAICHKNPHSGSIVSSGPVTIKDSNWFYGFSISRQPHFKIQKTNEIVIWTYGLFSDKPGNFIKKKITECAGWELCAEWLYHIGVPESDIETIAKKYSNTVPCHMPYITSYFMPRAKGDRPLVVPKNATNFAFIGNYAETERDTVFTIEYSARTAMEAVYSLLGIERGIPEVYPSCFDIRVLFNAIYHLNDKKKLKDAELPWLLNIMKTIGLQKIRGSYLEELLKEAKLV